MVPEFLQLHSFVTRTLNYAILNLSSTQINKTPDAIPENDVLLFKIEKKTIYTVFSASKFDTFQLPTYWSFWYFGLTTHLVEIMDPLSFEEF